MSSQVIPFPCAANDLGAIFDGLAAQARAGRLTAVMFAALDETGDTRNALTGHYGLSIDERAALVTHMHFDTIDSFVDYKFEEDV